ncbi:hypothetical protein BBJ28_00025657, partial [Nothophytophthora sp. Chile5]
MNVALWLLVLGGVAAQTPTSSPPDGTQFPGSTTYAPYGPVGTPSPTPTPTSAPTSTPWTFGSSTRGSASASSSSSSSSSGSGSDWRDAGWKGDWKGNRDASSGSSGSDWRDAGWYDDWKGSWKGNKDASSSGSGWVDAGWDGDAGLDPNGGLWRFQPPWNWDSPYPPVGTTYRSQWPAREIETRHSFQFAPDRGVALVGAGAASGHVNCSSHDWCVHLAFHSSYGVLSDLDALVLDRFDSAQRLQDEDRAAGAFAPLVLGSFTPEERSVLRNLSDWGVQDMARRFNETRVTTWTLFPEADELDVVLSFKQLFTLLPGYPDGDASSASDASSSEWGAEDHILLRVMAKREGSGATSALLPQVLNFTGSQLFQVDYMSSLEYPADAGDDLTVAASGMKLDVVLGRRRFGSAIPWDPARPSDLCDACDRQLLQDPRVAHCLHSRVPEHVFQRIFEATAATAMPWDDGAWTAEDREAPADGIFRLNDVVDACFGLRWLRSGLEDGSGSWASSNSDRGEAGTAGSWTSSSSRSSSAGFRSAGSNDGSRWSSSGSADVGAGEWPSIRDLQDALALTREADAGIQCFVASRCPVGDRNFAQAAGRMIVLEHERAVLRVSVAVPSYAFYLWLALDQTHFSTPVLSSSESPERLAELIANAVPNANDYRLAVDVRYSNNSEHIRLRSRYNDWLENFYSSGGSASEVADAAPSYFADSDGFSAGSDEWMAGLSPDAGRPTTHNWHDTPMDVPEPAFTVEISFRNVSVVPEVLDVLA